MLCLLKTNEKFVKRKGSTIAAEIIADWKREEYYKKQVKRNQCIVDYKKQCNIRKYREICKLDKF